ncbi:MAG: hypothetical protein QM790_13095 [Nibricoccus sp.]
MLLAMGLAGCSHVSHPSRPPSGEVAIHANAVGSVVPDSGRRDIELTVEKVVLFQKTGLFGADNFWDEYVVTLTNHSDKVFSVVSAELIDEQGAVSHPGNDPWTLANHRKTWMDRTNPKGQIGGGRVVGGALMVGAFGPLALVSPGCLFNWYSWKAYGITAAVVVPVYIIRAIKFNLHDNKKIEAAFHQRRIEIPRELRPGQTMNGSFFFPSTLNTRAFKIVVHTEDTDIPVSVDLSSVPDLHPESSKRSRGRRESAQKPVSP